jgi:hypothetical protein
MFTFDTHGDLQTQHHSITHTRTPGSDICLQKNKGHLRSPFYLLSREATAEEIALQFHPPNLPIMKASTFLAWSPWPMWPLCPAAVAQRKGATHRRRREAVEAEICPGTAASTKADEEPSGQWSRNWSSICYSGILGSVCPAAFWKKAAPKLEEPRMTP